MSPKPRIEQVSDSSPPAAPIGVFDSGIGGLSVFQALRAHLPRETLYYVADQAHVPYGSRTLEEIRHLSTRITRFLLGKSAKLVVVACNTASAAALLALREQFPSIPFVGMEPAVKPAAYSTQSAFIGVLATPATFRGAPYGSLLDRFAQEVTVLEDTCPGLVNQIEAGEWDAPRTHEILENALAPMLAQGIDRIVLGCTHYPFVIPHIKAIVGPGVQVIDPAPAIAQQTARLLAQHGLANPGQTPAAHQIWTTGAPDCLAAFLPDLLDPSRLEAEGDAFVNYTAQDVQVNALQWIGDRLSEAPIS